MPDKRQQVENKNLAHTENSARNSDFVLDKVIFANVFEKDIRRIYIYRKSERLAKAIHLIAPAFTSAPSLRARLDSIAVALIDAAILPPITAREALSKELLALSSLLAVARTSALLSEMNADLITRETHQLLYEIAGYEEPRLTLDEVPSLADFVKQANRAEVRIGAAPVAVSASQEVRASVPSSKATTREEVAVVSKGQSSDSKRQSDRQEAILDILQSKGDSYIKDISLVIKDVSEKTIQRELQALVFAGKVTKTGERRWTRYALA